jgi:cytochrome c-type biogenesis protein CcmH/NrfG
MAIKVLYRLAVAYEATKEFGKATKELQKLLHFESTNKEGVRIEYPL